MLYPLLFPLADQFQGFNLFRYITFRSGGAVVTALLISFLCGPRIIAWLRSKQANGQPIRLDGPGLAKPDDLPHAVVPRVETDVVPAGRLGMLAELRYAHKLPMDADEALYLRSPDVTLSSGPKRVTG